MISRTVAPTLIRVHTRTGPEHGVEEAENKAY
jgi:hypothetical protein